MATDKTTPLHSFLNSFTELLDQCSAWRLEPLLQGMLLARGRQTVTSWLLANQHTDDFRQFYQFLATVGRSAQPLFAELQRQVFAQLPASGRLIISLDDSPTKRVGPKIQGASFHHNPTPGLAYLTLSASGIRCKCSSIS